MMRLNVAVFAVALSLVGALLSPAPASAGEYAVNGCSTPIEYPFETSFWEVSSSHIQAVDNCPSGIQLNMPTGSGPSPYAVRNELGFASLNTRSSSKIKSVSFDVTGGDTSGDIEYSVRGCYECAPAKAFYATPAGTTVRVDAQFSGTGGLYLEAKCVVDSCTRTSSMNINRIEILADDDITRAPWVSSTPTFALNPDYSTWVRPDGLEADFSFEDYESGVRSAKATVGGQTIWSAANQCVGSTPPSSLMVCPLVISRTGPLPLPGITDGVYEFRLTNVNGAGEPGADPWIATLKIDGTPPPKPKNLRLVEPDGEGNVVLDSVIDIAFDDVTEDPVNVAGSGVEYSYFDVDPLDDGLADPPFQIANYNNSTGDISLPSEGSWRVQVWVVDGAGNVGAREKIDVTYDKTPPGPPALMPTGWKTLAALDQGLVQTWTAPDIANVESGICGYAVQFDDDRDAIPAIDMDELVSSTSVAIPKSLGAGRHFVHARSVACSGLASATDTKELNIDGDLPTITFSGASREGWSVSPASVSINGNDGTSGIATIQYRFGLAGATTNVSGDQATLVLSDGEYDLQARAVDVAGNASDWVSRRVLVDSTSPSAVLEGRDPSNPLALIATASDAASGLDSAWVEIRRLGPFLGWTSVGEVDRLRGDGAKSLARTIPENDLPPGRYAVRVCARDLAGNAVSPGAGSPGYLELDLPLRPASRITAAIAFVKRGQPDVSSASSFRRISYGREVAIVGRLRDSRGEVLARREVTASAEIVNTDTTKRYSATTRSDGSYTIPIPRGPSRNIAIRFAGDRTEGQSEQLVRLRVRAVVSLRASTRAVKVGRTVRFTGRLASGSDSLQVGGKDVSIEFFSNGRWMPTVGVPSTTSKGRFTAKWSPTSARRPTTVYFHARVKSTGWPYETGVSKSIAVRVRP
ncbi:MAG: carboxypeptidase regulatory-like domain-containing protein [Solirubrobacterales bacterium]|nr:carboxypeptidase regulatory-like domain-containing protein [Solirubrobacterales bacterium]